MDSKVRVSTDPESGKVITVSEGNPSYGYCRVTQERTIMDENGWARVRVLSALVPGTVGDLEKMGWVAGQFLPGKIVIKEQLTPFNKKNPEKNIKIAGDTGIVCKDGENPIYRNTVYNPNPNAEDKLWAHTNGEEIRNAYSGAPKEDGEKEVNDFSL
jgi:hypothetical protein